MLLATDTKISNPHAIQQIFVEKLFGQFTYRLGAGDHSDHLSNLMILYGDNGSGKTTILQLITHLLWHEPGKGHKNFVARIPFERFGVSFADGTCVEAKREPGKLDGSYSCVISKDQEVPKTAEFRTGEDGRLTSDRDANEKSEIAGFLSALRELNISLHYLSDDRKLYEEVVEKPGRWRRHWVRVPQSGSFEGTFFSTGYRTVFTQQEPEIPPLDLAMARAFEWVRDRADRGIGEGERDTHKIYTDVIRVIAESQEPGGEESGPDQLRQLRVRLQSLARRSQEYSKYGLMSSLHIDEMLNILTKDVDSNRSKIIYNILKPYAEGFEARLKALEELYGTLELFVDTLNGFFRNKSINFHRRVGFKISAKGGGRIDPSLLSSGEKQILLLFCNTLASRDQATIFIVDEPEISLNIKWQRQLVQSLLKCIKGSPVQFILATHSIELLAQHKPSVVVLKDLEG